MWRHMGVVGLCGILCACTTANPYYDASKPHHTPTGFRNNHVHNDSIDTDFMDWFKMPDLAEQVPTRAVDVSYLHHNHKDISVTWLGHSTALWQIEGFNILIDPHFGDMASPIPFFGPSRQTPVPVALQDLPHIDLVFVSHNHYDHLDKGTVLDLKDQPGGEPLFIVPLGMDKWLQNKGITKVKAMDWWESTSVKNLKVTLTPVQHWSRRSLFDKFETLWAGYVVQADHYSMYYAGDTGYSPDFKTIGKKFGGFDFAQIPVGCHEPRERIHNQHANEDDAMKIHQDINSKLSLGVHWGVFRLCHEAINSPITDLPLARKRHGIADNEFVLFDLGETRVLKKTQ